MNNSLDLFAALTCCLEDLHGLSIEAQAADQSDEMLLILAGQIYNGLYRCCTVTCQIETLLRVP